MKWWDTDTLKVAKSNREQSTERNVFRAMSFYATDLGNFCAGFPLVAKQTPRRKHDDNNKKNKKETI